MTGTHDLQTALPAPSLVQRGQVLFLDVDGTLCAIAARPDHVSFDTALRRVLAGVSSRLDHGVALVSGRPLDWLMAETGGLPLALVGTHGLEIRHADGRETLAALRPGLAAARDAVGTFAAAHPGVVVENKARGIALHYRLAPHSAPVVVGFAQELARRHDLPVQRGKLVIELKGGDGDKGDAVRALLQVPPFAGRVPIYAGDDITDEAGFAAVAEAGGFGVLVGPPRPTAARFGLPDPPAVRAWLQAL